MTVSGFSRHDLEREMGAEQSGQKGLWWTFRQDRRVRDKARKGECQAHLHCVGVCERSSPPGRQASFETGTEKEQVIFQNIT